MRGARSQDGVDVPRSPSNASEVREKARSEERVSARTRTQQALRKAEAERRSATGSAHRDSVRGSKGSIGTPGKGARGRGRPKKLTPGAPQVTERPGPPVDWAERPFQFVPDSKRKPSTLGGSEHASLPSLSGVSEPPGGYAEAGLPAMTEAEKEGLRRLRENMVSVTVVTDGALGCRNVALALWRTIGDGIVSHIARFSDSAFAVECTSWHAALFLRGQDGSKINVSEDDWAIRVQDLPPLTLVGYSYMRRGYLPRMLLRMPEHNDDFTEDLYGLQMAPPGMRGRPSHPTILSHYGFWPLSSWDRGFELTHYWQSENEKFMASQGYVKDPPEEAAAAATAAAGEPETEQDDASSHSSVFTLEGDPGDRQGPGSGADGQASLRSGLRPRPPRTQPPPRRGPTGPAPQPARPRPASGTGPPPGAPPMAPGVPTGPPMYPAMPAPNPATAQGRPLPGLQQTLFPAYRVGGPVPRMRKFTGSPTPKNDEATYEQFRHEALVMLQHHDGAVVKEAIVRAVSGSALDCVNGTDPQGSVLDLLERLDRYYGTVEDADVLMREYFGPSTEKEKTVAQVASRLENLRRKINRYAQTELINTSSLRERFYHALSPSVKRLVRHQFDDPHVQYGDLLRCARRAEAEERQSGENKAPKKKDEKGKTTVRVSQATTTPSLSLEEQVATIAKQMAALTAGFAAKPAAQSTSFRGRAGPARGQRGVGRGRGAGRGRGTPPDFTKPPVGVPDTRCWRCHGYGHMSRECPTERGRAQGEGTAGVVQGQTASAEATAAQQEEAPDQEQEQEEEAQ